MPKISWGMVELGIVPVPSLGAADTSVCPCHSAQLSLLRHCSHSALCGDRGVNAGGFQAQRWGVSPLCVWGQALLHLGWWGLGVEQGGMCGERRGQDPAVTAGSDLHGGDVSWAGGGLKGSQGPRHSPIILGTLSRWD